MLYFWLKIGLDFERKNGYIIGKNMVIFLVKMVIFLIKKRLYFL